MTEGRIHLRQTRGGQEVFWKGRPVGAIKAFARRRGFTKRSEWFAHCDACGKTLDKSSTKAERAADTLVDHYREEHEF